MINEVENIISKKTLIEREKEFYSQKVEYQGVTKVRTSEATDETTKRPKIQQMALEFE